MTTRWSRVLRGAGAGTTATLAAAASHTLAGGHEVSGAALALALAFAVLVAVALAGRALSLWRLAASTVIGQGAFHVLFSTLGGAAEVVTVGHHQTVLAGTEIVTHASGGMWTAHGIAAALTFALLAFGERAFVGIRDTGWMLLRAVLTAPAPLMLGRNRVPEPAVVAVLAPRIVRELHTVRSLRGPPLALRGA